jgi:hypothetical protein
VLSWFENLEERFIPPRRIWTDAKRLKKHMDRVKQIQKDEAKGRSSEVEDYDGEMVENPAVAMFVIDND